MIQKGQNYNFFFDRSFLGLAGDENKMGKGQTKKDLKNLIKDIKKKIGRPLRGGEKKMIREFLKDPL